MIIKKRYIFNLIFTIFTLLLNLSNCYADNAKSLDKEKINWTLINFYYSSTGINYRDSDAVRKKLQNISLKSIDDIFFIDGVSVKNKRIEPNENYLTNHAKQYLREKVKDFDEKNFIYYDINLPNSIYQISSPIAYLPKSSNLIVFTKTGSILIFEPTSLLQKKFANIDKNLPEIKLPIDYSFFKTDYMEKFADLPDYFNFYLGGNAGDGILEVVKLNSNSPNYKLFLLSSYDDIGNPFITLMSLSNDFKLVDRIILKIQYELENGSIDVDASIDNDDKIEIRKIKDVSDQETQVLSVVNYITDNKGYFRKKDSK